MTQVKKNLSLTHYLQDNNGIGDSGVGPQHQLWSGGDDPLELCHLVQVDVDRIGTVILVDTTSGVGSHQPDQIPVQANKGIVI